MGIALRRIAGQQLAPVLARSGEMTSAPAIRVIAIGLFRVGDRILVARGVDPASGEGFYRPLGGRVEFGERAAAALSREISEELGGTIEGLHLLGVLENLFEYTGRPHHEIVFVFDARFADPTWYDRAELTVTETGTEWDPARWLSIDTIASGPDRLVPDGLLALLTSSPPR
jgi:ADP-ribose pyrophosphatase YjhB (NUDIX family)